MVRFVILQEKKPLWQKYIILIQVLQHEPEYRNSWSSSRASGTFSPNQFADVDSDLWLTQILIWICADLVLDPWGSSSGSRDTCGSSSGSVSLYRIRIRNFTRINGYESGSDLSPWNIWIYRYLFNKLLGTQTIRTQIIQNSTPTPTPVPNR